MRSENSNSTETITNEIEDIIKNTAIGAANVEKLGALLLSFGYSTFIKASDIDILEVLNKNNTGITSFSILVFGQKFTLLGYILLYIAASKRLNEKTLANLHESEKNDLLAFEAIKNAYIGSIILNYLRLVEFIKLEQEERQKEDSQS